MMNPIILTETDVPLVITSNSLSFSQAYARNLPKLIAAVAVTPLEINFRVYSPKLRPLAALFRNSTTFRASTLVDIAVTDKLETRGRFSVIYCFLSTHYNQRFTIELFVTETLSVSSIANPFFLSVVFSHQPVDLNVKLEICLGFYFTENGDLRRILTDYGFASYPLRKDFPLTGFFELVYNDAEGRVTSEPLELSQEFRVFHL